jgi:hypothetical protein
MISRSKQGTCKITAYLRIGRNPKSAAKEAPHEAFANTGDTPEAFEAFAKLWEPLWRGWEDIRFANKLNVRDNLRAAWRGDEHVLASYQRSMATIITPTKKHIEIKTHDFLGTITLLFLRDYWAGRIGICANQKCPNPYFIRKRKTQKYCEAGPCTGEAQRQQKLNWWNRVGKIRAKKETQRGRTA